MSKSFKIAGVLYGIALVLILYLLFDLSSELKLTRSVMLTDSVQKPPLTQLDSIRLALAKMGCERENVPAYSVALLTSCSRFKADWKWVIAQMRRESYFDPAAKSFAATQMKGDKEREYAYGLMQIKPNTGREIAKDLGEEYREGILMDGVTNIRWGTYYFQKKMLKHRFNPEKAVKEYNAGSQRHWEAVEENYINICQLN